MQELLPMPTMFLSVYSVHIYESSQKLTLNIILKSWFASSNILFVISIHQTTNFVSPNFFYEFFSVWAVEKDTKLFIGQKNIFSQFWNQRKFCFLFQLLNWENFVEKIKYYNEFFANILNSSDGFTNLEFRVNNLF